LKRIRSDAFVCFSLYITSSLCAESSGAYDDGETTEAPPSRLDVSGAADGEYSEYGSE
jgi:hypothetical protein